MIQLKEEATVKRERAMAYAFFHQANGLRLTVTSRVVISGVVEGWVTYREVIRDSVRVRPKHEKRSGGDCRVSKQ
ncbi:hypothetical protein YC2023_062257 [Brassica napus]